ncbi:unnamed protein product, partial [Rotaria sp. Silwood1]
DHQTENVIVESYNDEQKHLHESLLKSEESDITLPLSSTIDHTQTNNNTNQYLSKIEPKVNDFFLHIISKF